MQLLLQAICRDQLNTLQLHVNNGQIVSVIQLSASVTVSYNVIYRYLSHASSFFINIYTEYSLSVLNYCLHFLYVPVISDMQYNL